MPPRQTRKRLQNGGKDLYISVHQITEDIIEKTFCNNLTIADLPVQNNPIFVLKWGPPGSGKSSAKMNEFIRSFGIPLKSYMNYNSDDVFEAFMPFRMETALEKMKSLRAFADYEVRDFEQIKEHLQSFVLSATKYKKYVSKELINRVDTFLQSWPSGQRLSFEKKEKLDALLREMSEATATALYAFYRNDAKNARGLSIQEKLKLVLVKAFRERVNIMYESTGSGYGTNIIGTVRNTFSGLRSLRTTAQKPVNIIELFKNSKERLLGKILYDKNQEPIGIDTSSLTEESVPLDYRILVVYPILPKKEIIHRAYSRALKTFTGRNSFTIPNNSLKEEYIGLYTSFLMEIMKIMGNSRYQTIIDEIIKKENDEYKDSYSSYIKSLIATAETDVLRPPFFRSISIEKIEDTIEQAFQYSIDYFLKQYLVIGRIERIVYISTLGEKYTDPVPRNYVNVVI